MRLLYVSQIPWNAIKQRPQFLAEYFAKAGNEVCFFSRNAIGKGQNTISALSPFLTIQERTVLPGALKFPAIDRLNSLYLRSNIPWKKFDAVFFTEPRQALFLPLPEDFTGKIIYDCMDQNPDFYTGKTKIRLQKLEKKLCDRVHLIVVSALRLKKYLMDTYSIPADKIKLIRNGVNETILTNAPPIAGELVYIGTIDSWFDWESILFYATRHPERTITLIGPVRRCPPTIPGNIVLTGAVSHDRVVQYIRGAALLLIPFLVPPLIKAVDPIKMYEYLAFGKNVLSSYWDELDHFLPNHHLHFYRSPWEFEKKAEQILHTLDSSKTSHDYAFISQNNWKKRSIEYLNLLK